ncbi:methylmalonyl Co-A mutase-associated GTPase MeaB [Prosthecochloris sp. HL-130-GSB]|jgi:LAO/AO transport system kinase|uniref:methylmalonyl Co-A mutase-associated GTPase MeaB n=1 Tax=Prosthecochloris sp. HL-130-GSB TaxID=1974213 RepID=UPI000A1C131E|nr:methylmalonyl Co-A mutase-associated GTPase MeaB [Prosthecochloris sp. HL-130-GSB]ARM31049.1 methylmalonyl Co-A mutase-associated GTPase MeaB [Prosthecochloris sp. HL-130-GSB]
MNTAGPGRTAMTTPDIVEGIRSGRRSALSRAITLIESQRDDHQEKAHDILDACLEFRADSFRIGITGPPGVGKSTLIEALGEEILSDSSHRLAVLSIDPSSERSRGSILGDKARMEKLSALPDVFIRPSPSSGHLGGTSPKTHEVIMLCEAAGYNVIIVETVGVGQSEISVESMVDYILLLIQPGSGDELQGMKRGIMEIADAIAVTKSDVPSSDAVERSVASCRSALGLLRPSYPCWKPSVFTCSSVNKTGIREIWQNAEEFARTLKEHGLFDHHRQEQLEKLFRAITEQELHRAFFKHPLVTDTLPAISADIRNNRLSPFSGARRVVGKVIPLHPPR